MPKVFSMDAVALKVGMDVVRIHTNDGGRSWQLTPDRITGIKLLAAQVKCLCDPCSGWTNTRNGESRIFVDPAKAVVEARKRTVALTPA